MIQKDDLIFQSEEGWKTLASLIEEMEFSTIFLIVDENTKIHCLPLFYEKIRQNNRTEVLQVSSGEKFKNIDSCMGLWEQLSSKGADRNSLIINIGGGMITDLGGFVASTFKRGLVFVNIPTTLLAMVDASIGGKNGIDFQSAKNQIGTINLPRMVVIEPTFLNTLPQREFISGIAEMLKHSLIYSLASWNRIKNIDLLDKTAVQALLWESIKIKSEIVASDPLEQGLRKTLNYGHTLGHAIESYFLGDDDHKPILHGEAIAIGLILATYLSYQLLSFPEKRLMEVSEKIISIFPKQKFIKKDIEKIIKLLIFDKKNRNGKVYFVLMREIGIPETDWTVSNDLIFNAFDFYKNL